MGIPNPSSLGQSLMAQGLLNQATPQNTSYPVITNNSSYPMQMTMMGYKPLAFLQTSATPTTFKNFANGFLPTPANTASTWNQSAFP